MAKMEYTPKSERDNNKKNNSLLVKAGTVLAGMVVALGAGLYGYDSVENIQPVEPEAYETTVDSEYEVNSIEGEDYVVILEEDDEGIEDEAAEEPGELIAETVEGQDENSAAGEAQEAVGNVEAVESQLRFRNKKLLNSHYDKHGREMGFANASEYEMAAAQVVANPDALHKTEAEDGDDVYYVEATNDFVIVSTDGYIRTYYRPNSGKAYFDRQ